jgi:glycosyltransferase involved in cell wall biosynthesis
MAQLNLVVATQTPLLRFDSKGTQPGPAGPDLPPHRLSPGGVCRMVLPTIQQLRDSGFIRQAHWYSLNPGAPPEVALEEGSIRLHHLQMRPEELEAYGRSKEKLWADIHGLPHPPLQAEDFRQYARYNARTADRLLEHAGELDLAYIHDFQLMQVGSLVGLAAPCVLRWHVPWDPRRMPPYTRKFLLSVMEDFDAVIVSTRRDLQGLVDAGFHGKVRQAYPHIEPKDWPAARPDEITRLEEAWGLQPDDPLLLMVARMDPMKRHDLAIQAFAAIRRKHPRAKLALVGNGSFSGRLGSSVGPGKADLWRAQVEKAAADAGVTDQVIFASWVPDGLLAAAYTRAAAVLLPSDIEGFGLTPLEGWIHGRPPVVSDGIGAAEIVTPGVNGLVFPARDAAAFAAQLDRILSDPEAATRMGENGRATLPAFTAEASVPKVRAVLDEALSGFRRAMEPQADAAVLA